MLKAIAHCGLTRFQSLANYGNKRLQMEVDGSGSLNQIGGCAGKMGKQ